MPEPMLRGPATNPLYLPPWAKQQTGPPAPPGSWPGAPAWITTTSWSSWAAASRAPPSCSAPPAPSIPLATLPFFPRYTATGHHAQGWSVPIGDKMVLVFAGRCHLYEDIDLADVVHPLRTGIAAGCSTVILTAAVGGIREDLAHRVRSWPSRTT